MQKESFELNDETLKVVEEIGRHMPGGFFIYKAKRPEELIYANHAVFDIFGCKDLDEFKELTGYTFQGMLHPEDYAAISDSIEEQIDKNDDNMDYVEYRIVRKDGSIRWVDDFGHFTETETYGGVYYVFISDITEKRERIQEELEEANRRLVEEIESAAKLADLMGSVSSLLTNMPAMSFSKDAKSGIYLACNQSFAEYAHKKSPEEVVGLTDYDIFDAETAQHFVDDDKKAVSMDAPYIFFEDVPDAVGKVRNLQTTKMKFTDSSGRLCTLGMCVDVTEMTRIKSAEAEAHIKQQELEEKIALQEKLLQQSETLKDALKAAEEASRAKSNFLSNMSHEIRTPITAILGMNELIRRESTDKGILEYSNNIRKAGTSLLAIINDILDFSKIEAGRMDLINVDYKVSALIADLANLVRFRLEDKGLLFITDIDPHLPSVLYGDELRIKQVITNLLTNAAKYTEKGEVTLTIALEGRRESDVDIRVSVKDTGIGIREEELDLLFSAFDRLDVIRTRGIEGTGLGLAISSRMLELMDSRLEVQSTYGEGSEFSFVLRQRVVDATEIGTFDLASSLVSLDGGSEKPLEFTAPSARVLLVDDTPLNLQVIAGLLKRTMVGVDTASSGEECIAKFGAADAYDMVFLDYRMPRMDGIETLKRLYELYPDKAKRTPIVSLTASAVAGDRERMLGAGFDDYLAKPVNIAEMEGMMVKYLPPNKVTLSVGKEEERDELGLLPKALFDIDIIEPEAGIEYCGEAEDYIDAIEVFASSIGKKASGIEQAWQEQDLAAYTNLVHSLKSTSRAVGALRLSDMALELEMAGKNEDLEQMTQKTPAFLELYRSLQSPLQQVVELWEEEHE